MKRPISILALLLPVALTSATVVASAQEAPRAEVAATYNWVHSNVLPTGCGCFSLNGGSGSFAWRFTPSFSAVAEAGATANGNVESTGLGLTLANFTAGPRYTFHNHTRVQPFGQLLLGAAHASGELSPSQLGLGSATAFAMETGGGADWTLSHNVSIRLVQADYFLSLLPNRSSDHQNNLRVSAGVAFHFGKKK
jgi:peptidoglycan-associated lipoprotein